MKITNPQIIEIIIAALVALAALGSLIVAIISLKSSKAAKKQQIRLREKQEELLDIQLKQHKKIVERGSSIQKSEKSADIRVSLEGSSRNARFVIRNWGEAAADHVDVNVEPVDGHSSPLIEGDIKSKLPIPRLAPGADCSLIAAITFDSGTTFDVLWTWEEMDGTKKSERSRLSL